MKMWPMKSTSLGEDWRRTLVRTRADSLFAFAPEYAVYATWWGANVNDWWQISGRFAGTRQ